VRRCWDGLPLIVMSRITEAEWAAASTDLPRRTLFALRHPWISSVPCAVFAAALFAGAGLRPMFVGLVWLGFYALSLGLLAARRRSLFHDERPTEEQRSVEPRSNVRSMP
jgi:hypothetical protein